MSTENKHIITIFFEPPFWTVLFERFENGKYSVAKEIIGTSELKNAEILIYFENLDFDKLQYSVPIEEKKSSKARVSFKKMQKKSKKIMQESNYKHTYSKAHGELKKLREQQKNEVKAHLKIKKENDNELKFELKQLKKKQKMRGH